MRITWEGSTVGPILHCLEVLPPALRYSRTNRTHRTRRVGSGG